MLTNFFDKITRASLQFKWVTIIGSFLVMALGVYAMTGLNLELLPSIEFPQTFVVAQWPDAESADDFLNQVTIPLEEKLSAIENVVNVESTTNPGFAFIIVRNDFGVDQAKMLQEIETAVSQTTLPEGMEMPQVLNFSLSDLPVVIASVSSSELTLAELKELVTTDLQPQLEEIDQISLVTIGGGQELPSEEEAVAEVEPTLEPTPEPGQLPLVVVEGASQLGIEVEYAQDVTVDMLRGISGTPEQILAVLNLLPQDTLPYAPPETLSYLPKEFIETLPADLAAELDELAAEFGGTGQYTLAEVTAVLNGEEIAQATPTAEPTPEPTVEPTPEVTELVTETAELPTVAPVALPEEWIAGAAQFGLTISTTADITPEFAGQLAAAAPDQLALLTPDMWRALDPSVLAIAVPVAAQNLDAALLAELNAIQQTAAGIAPEPVALPAAWITAAEYAGLTVETTADIPADALTLIATSTPELLDTLTPEMILAFSPDVQAALPAEYVATLDAGLQQTLANIAVYAALNTAVSETTIPQFAPVALPEEWIAGAAQFGLTISTTADITPEFAGQLAAAAPDQLALLTPDMWRALSPDVTALLLPVAGETLEAELLAQLTAIQLAANGQAPKGVELPESWIAAGTAAGFPIQTTADIPAEAAPLLVGTAPELLADLTPEQLLAFAPGVLAALPADYLITLDSGLQQTIANIVIASVQYETNTAVTEQPTPTGDEAGLLPDLLIQGAQAAGVEIQYAQDITPDFMRLLAGFGPQGLQALQLLTPDNLRLLQPEVIALLPMEFVDTLDADLKAELDGLAAEFGGAGQLAVQEAASADPARLPEALIQGATAAGFEIEMAQDITPDMMRLFAGIGPQGIQILQLLTADHLRLLQPEVIALLPMEFIDTLDADLKAELDELAAEFGGAGQLAVQEAEAAAALSAGAPPLTGLWAEPGPDGEPPLFQTAADILSNSFVPGAANFLNFLPTAPNVQDPAGLIGDLTPDVVQFLAENEADFAQNLSPQFLELMSPESLTYLLDTYPDAFDAELTERLRGIAAGNVTVFIPETSITRTDGNPALVIQLYKDGDANTVEVAHRIFDLLDEYKTEHPEIETTLAFEQATFIEDSIAGVSREGALGGVFAVLIILIFLSGHVGGRYRLSWRATLVTAVSIPLSIFTAFLLMRWVPPTFGVWFHNLADSTGNGAIAFFAQLFPKSVTLNIMTLSGLTVAIGRVVDDSIVVLENSYRYIQQGDDPKHAVLEGTKEVAIAIFSATVTTVAVFLPLGLIGGVIGSFFLPFGLTVTYALAASFVVAITVVPALTYLMIRKEHIPEEKETSMQRWYTPILVWALKNRFATLMIAAVIFLGSLFLLGQLPQSFIPGLGEPTINITVNLPAGTAMADTDELVQEFETAVSELAGIETVQTEVGGAGGVAALFGGGGNVNQNQANLTVSSEDQEELQNLTIEIRSRAEEIFGEENVTVSAASQTGFSGFGIIVTGDSLDDLRAIVPDVKAALESVDIDGDGIQDIANVSSSIDSATGTGGDSIIRIDGRPAINFSGELETENTLGVTDAAKQAVAAVETLPAGAEVTEGFDSQQQVEGFQSMVTAIGYSILIVYAVMALTFRSFIHPFTILFSIPFALVGAAVALYITNSVLGISAMIGLMMLVGIVVTNGIVLMELVQQLRHRGKNAYDALVEGGRTRLRPIWMTALAAILALIPLGASNEAGAIIAAELARAVMGGLLVSTALTLVVIPVIYSLFDELGKRLSRR